MPRLIDDILGELLELGQSTTQKTGQAIKSVTLDAFAKGAKELIGNSNNNPSETQPKNQEKQNKPNHTPLDIEKLQKIYEDQDKKKINQLRDHLFRLIKSEEKKAQEERKKEEMERKKKEEMEQEEKKRQQLLKAKQQEELPIPKGKERKSIFAPRKLIKRSLAETRVGAGKQ